MMVTIETGPPRFFPRSSLTFPMTTSINNGIYKPWERYLVVIATVVKVTRLRLFFSHEGPKAHPHAKSHGNGSTNNWETAWPSFALYNTEILMFSHQICTDLKNGENELWNHWKSWKRQILEFGNLDKLATPLHHPLYNKHYINSTICLLCIVGNSDG